jgi:hypothetical protein
LLQRIDHFGQKIVAYFLLRVFGCMVVPVTQRRGIGHPIPVARLATCSRIRWVCTLSCATNFSFSRLVKVLALSAPQSGLPELYHPPGKVQFACRKNVLCCTNGPKNPQALYLSSGIKNKPVVNGARRTLIVSFPSRNRWAYSRTENSSHTRTRVPARPIARPRGCNNNGFALAHNEGRHLVEECCAIICATFLGSFSDYCRKATITTY